MSGDSVVLDTNIVLYLLKGDDKLEALLQGANVFLSVITKVELLSHPDLDEAGEQVIRELLQSVKLMEFTSTIQERTVLLRRQFKMKLPDAVIAATAAFLNIRLITADKKFARLKDELDVLLIER
ncbi:MAG TPA: type II toxin-antitoxin system VapC family toxin [Flavobacteriales bacterium]|nr:type II toxin-antitoxin system VapC family toxin [Flavobacteriales bacterium]HRO38699.1 type II toxin-antitoxin system VapC family toxin [Flavobacteriales bacterium]HRQ85479.1 type II toxin-antitoxin system VapC family toxin [Flavobacteriales bacterium]